MGYYRQLPLDVRIAIWLERVKFYPITFGIFAAMALGAVGMLLFTIAWAIVRRFS
jgi:hypothetical protein